MQRLKSDGQEHPTDINWDPPTILNNDNTAGRGDAHGDSGRQADKNKARRAELEAELAELERDRGSKREQQKIRRKLKNLDRNSDTKRKGETHGRGGRGQQRR